MSFEKQKIHSPHGKALGDCWSVVNYFINLGLERNEVIELSLYAYKGESIKRSDKMSEILPLLEHCEMVKLVEKDPTEAKIHWTKGFEYPFVPTKIKWEPNQSNKICYQFDGKSKKGEKNFASPELEQEALDGMRGLGYELIKIGHEMTLEECVIEVASSELFVGIDSGMCHLAASVGAPIVFCRNQSPMQKWEDNHSNKHYVLSEDNADLIKNIRQYKEEGLIFYINNAANLHLFKQEL